MNADVRTATASPEIKIVRDERKCSFNDDVRSGKTKSHPIYDWRVMIDGEHRATFRPGIYKGYNLHNADGFYIKGASDHGPWVRRSDVATKAEFKSKIIECLAKGLIPTLAQLSEARAERKRKRAASDAAQKEHERIAQIRDAAPDLLDALKGLRHVIEAAGLLNLMNGVQLGPTVWYVKASDAVAAATDAIVKAEPVEPPTETDRTVTSGETAKSESVS